MPPSTAFQKLGELPTTPFYGEVPGAGTSLPSSYPIACTTLTYRLVSFITHTVDGSPDSKCGTCWELQYNNQPPVYMIAVDNAAMIQLGGDAFKTFAGDAGIAQGSVDATAVQVDAGKCGLP